MQPVNIRPSEIAQGSSRPFLLRTGLLFLCVSETDRQKMQADNIRNPGIMKRF